MPPAATTVRGRFADSSTRYSPTPTLSACRSSQACSSLTGISLRRPRRTRRTSGSICAHQVSQDTPSASHACSTLRARAGALCFRTAKVTAARGDIGAITVTDPNLHGPAKRLREEPVRARHWRAHLKGPRRAKPRGRPQAPDTCASLRQSPAPPRNHPTTKRSTRPRRSTSGCATTRTSAPQKVCTYVRTYRQHARLCHRTASAVRISWPVRRAQGHHPCDNDYIARTLVEGSGFRVLDAVSGGQH
jgi:hypothetical protein